MNTCAIGLFCEDHGMVGNFMYDEEKGEKFSNMINAEAEHSHWWEYAEPFWITAVKQVDNIITSFSNLPLHYNSSTNSRIP